MLSRLSDRNRQRLRTITMILATALIIAPAAALAGHHFNDVPNSNIFHDDIDWMNDNGVTKGCNPPTNDEYCPDDFVTREQMAAFMHRLETEGVFLPADGKAADADRVDGAHAGDLVGAGVHVTRSGTDAPVVERWFNNVNGMEPTVTGSGIYTIDFGFDVTNRFIQCTIDTNKVDTRDATCTASTPSGNDVRVRIVDPGLGETAGEFWIHVYGMAAE